MAYAFDEAAHARMEGYVNDLGVILGNKRRRASFASYFGGLLGDGERKSVEPTVRSHARPERHFDDSFITVRQAMARAIARWLPRCPCRHRKNDDRHAP